MSSVPPSTELADAGQLLPPGDAYALLSRPVKDLQRADMLAIANDLRAKRALFLQGKADRPARLAKAKAPALSEEDKKALGSHVQGLLSGLKI